jgi:hypothetical protein
MGRETGSLQLLASLLLTGGKGADLVIRGNVVLNTKIHGVRLKQRRAAFTAALYSIFGGFGYFRRSELDYFR